MLFWLFIKCIFFFWIFLILQDQHIPQIDWESSGLIPSDPNCGIQVPEIECTLSPVELAGLNAAVDPLVSTSLVADVYLAALQYMYSIGYI